MHRNRLVLLPLSNCYRDGVGPRTFAQDTNRLRLPLRGRLVRAFLPKTPALPRRGVDTRLLRLTRLDGLRTDAEPDPPSAEACEPSEADGSEGRAVVGADDGGNAELTEDLDEYGLGELDRRGVQPSALEQESAETVLEW